MTIIQCYCTVNELIEDGDAALPVNALTRFVLPASTYLVGEIGAFLPLLETRKRTGKESGNLFVPPLLRLTGNVLNNTIAMDETDIQILSTLQSNQPWWQNGPYSILRLDWTSARSTVWCGLPNSIQIPGAWGLYERYETLSAELGDGQTDTETVLTVDDGGQVCPGMILKIGSEWEFVRGYRSPSNAVTTLGAELDNSSEIITVADGTALHVGEILRCEFEKMRILDIQGDNVFVARGWERSNRATHADGKNLDAYRTFSVEREINGSTAAAHDSGAAIERMLIPEDVNYLARQIATLMIKKSQTGYAGRSANAETGENFYNYEFPRDSIERVRSNYYIPAAR